MITAGLLLTAVAHPGMLFPNEILDSPVPADILNGSWDAVNNVCVRPVYGVRSFSRRDEKEYLRNRNLEREQLRMDAEERSAKKRCHPLLNMHALLIHDSPCTGRIETIMHQARYMLRLSPGSSLCVSW